MLSRPEWYKMSFFPSLYEVGQTKGEGEVRIVWMNTEGCYIAKHRNGGVG